MCSREKPERLYIRLERSGVGSVGGSLPTPSYTLAEIPMLVWNWELRTGVEDSHGVAILPGYQTFC